jgi:ankyrin repeat protein
LNIFLAYKNIDKLLREKDESYGNTPLHIACSFHQLTFTRILIENGADLTIKNLVERTPEEVVDEEIDKYRVRIDCEEKSITLERLSILKSLFAELTQ